MAKKEYNVFHNPCWLSEEAKKGAEEGLKNLRGWEPAVEAIKTWPGYEPTPLWSLDHRAADLGVAGKDILLEYEPDVYELLDLGIGKCRMCVAGPAQFRDDPAQTLRVATKFQHIAQSYYAAQSRQIDIIHLNGSIELAPILGLSDVIVDIVETGKTLLENGLAPLETICPISARLIANKAAWKFRQPAIGTFCQAVAQQRAENQ